MMKKVIRTAIAAAATACCVFAAALPAMAATADRPYVPVTDGSFRYTSKSKAREKLSTQDFNKQGVTISSKTHAVNQVYDVNGNLIPATLSSDGHWYIVPTNEGYVLMPTGA